MFLRWLPKARTQLKQRLEKRFFRVRSFALDKTCRDQGLDRVELEVAGLLRVVGREVSGKPDALESLRVRFDRVEVPPNFKYRFALNPGDLAFSGRVAEYRVTVGHSGVAQRTPSIQIEWNGRPIFENNERTPFTSPSYTPLLTAGEVFHREQIYTTGPPNQLVDSEVFALVKDLPGPVLDYGCGIGALVEAFRSRGTEAYGIEIDEPRTRKGVSEKGKPYLTWYDGKLPTPYHAEQFESLVCSEVLEHISNYAETVAEIDRLTRRNCVITVPDMSAVPLLSRHGVVPWHLLESTHVNFFNQRSLEKLLRKHFPRVDFVRMGALTVNGTRFYTSLAAICAK